MTDTKPRTIQPPFWVPSGRPPPRLLCPPPPRWSPAARRWYRLRRTAAENRQPPPWEVVRLASRMGYHGWEPYDRTDRQRAAWFEWLSAQPAALFRRSATFRLFAELAAVGAVFAGVVGLWHDFDRREEDRINTAWALVADAKQVEGNVGLGRALETLNNRGADLSALQAPKTYLPRVELIDATLNHAKLAGADLSNAKLTGAKLQQADLSGAKLQAAELSGADLLLANLSRAKMSNANLSGTNLLAANLRWAMLSQVNLSGAHLWGADLSHAFLSRADLSGANLSSADLSDAMLGATILKDACGDEKTKLPPGYTLPACPK
jgi:uncharacterized protein YjbI with pentapeptide repeats